MHAHGRALRDTFESEAAAQDITLSTSGAGTVFNVHPGCESAPSDYRGYAGVDLQAYTAFRKEMLQTGLQLLPDGRWYVGASHGNAELTLAQEAIRKTIGQLRG